VPEREFPWVHWSAKSGSATARCWESWGLPPKTCLKLESCNASLMVREVDLPCDAAGRRVHEYSGSVTSLLVASTSPRVARPVFYDLEKDSIPLTFTTKGFNIHNAFSHLNRPGRGSSQDLSGASYPSLPEHPCCSRNRHVPVKEQRVGYASFNKHLA